MKLTAKQGKGTKMHLYADEEYRFTINRELWASCGLVSGQQISEEEITNIWELSNRYKAKQTAYRILTQREHSRKELEDKLNRLYPTELAKDITDEMQDFGYIHDDEYAKLLAKELFRRKSYGASRIMMELRKRGINNDDIEDAMSLFDEQDFKENMAKLLKTKYSKDLGTEQGRRKAFAALARKGYTPNDIRSVMREYVEGEYDYLFD